MLSPSDRNKIVVGGLGIIVAVMALRIVTNGSAIPASTAVLPQNGRATPGIFIVNRGDGLHDIALRLHEQGLIRSPFLFKMLALMRGKATHLKPGRYVVPEATSTWRIITVLVEGGDRERTVLIPEGASLYDIDAILARAGVIDAGDLIAFAAEAPAELEGRMFPDTYNFFIESDIADVVTRFLDTFARKALPLVGDDPERLQKILTIASLVEKEVPEDEDRRIVAGIFIKRLESGIPLQVDATICYTKRIIQPLGEGGCLPISTLDLKIDSPYNTYLYKGLPPGPIGSPGVSALTAAIEPRSSPYWYYLSDPKTQKTIFASTFDEHVLNKQRYLR